MNTAVKGGHPNLSEGLNRIIAQGDSAGLQLRNVAMSDIIKIEFENNNVMVFQIVNPAGEPEKDDSAVAILVSHTLNEDKLVSLRDAGLENDPNGMTYYVIGACTKNPGAPLGMSMLQMHRIVTGRHLLWSMVIENDKEESFLFPEIVINWELNPEL